MRYTIPLFLALTLPAFGQFERHAIDDFPSGYQVAIADLNNDGRPDVIATSSDASLTNWYANPSWERQPVAELTRSVDIAPHDIDGDGMTEIAVISGFYFGDSERGGDISWLDQPDEHGQLWKNHPIAVDPVVHRIQWGDLDGDGRKELVHAPIFGRGSKANVDTKPVNFWAFRPPENPAEGEWEIWKIDPSLTVFHGVSVEDIDDDGRDEILTASYEGVHIFDYQGEPGTGQWKKTHISPGAEPEGPEPGAKRGTSEVGHGRLRTGREIIATVEPWHGDNVVVYVRNLDGEWERTIVDDTILGGHAVVIADFDGDDSDEIVVGWRRGEGGLALYDSPGHDGEQWGKTTLDSGIRIEDATGADINGDGLIDVVAVARVSNQLVWYENLGKK